MADLKTLSTIDTSPFKKLVLQLGGTPSVFSEGMTYYELLAYLVNFLEKEVVPKTNENIEAVKELQEYVSTYFDNLDVQEEINNKLDQMAEDGTLAEIVTAYLNAKSILAYNTISEMSLATNIIDGSFLAVYGLNELNDHVLTFYKAREIKNTDVVDGINLVALNDENLVAEIMADPQITGFQTTNELINANLLSGQIVKTLGYHTLNDGGGASYIISGTPGTVNIELNNGLYANLIFEEVNLMQFGCYGDGTTDDTSALQNAITVAKANNKKITSPSGKSYLTSETLNLTRINVDLNNSTFKSSLNIAIITIEEPEEHKVNTNYYSNITIDGSNVANGIDIINGHRNEFNNLNILKCEISVRLRAGFENNFTNTTINAKQSLTSVGFQIETSDCMFNKGTMIGPNTAFYILGNKMANISDFHCWPYGVSKQNASFIKSSGENIIIVENSISDSYHYVFNQVTNNQPAVTLTDCYLFWANDTYTDNPEYGHPVVFNVPNTGSTYPSCLSNCMVTGPSVPGFEAKLVPDDMKFEGFITNLRSARLINNSYREVTLQNPSSKFNIAKQSIVREERTITIEIHATFTGNTPSATDIVGYIPERYLPKASSYKGVCYVSDDSWADTNVEVATLNIIQNTRQLQVNLPNNGSTSTRYLRISCTYPRG